MTLGQQLGIWLPSLRTYATALAGDQSLGDLLVKHVLEEIVAAPESFPKTSDRRLGLARFFETVSAQVEEKGIELPDGTLTSVLTTDSRYPLTDRKIALLSVLLGFTIDEVSLILDISPEEIEHRLADTAGKLGATPVRRILIAEPEPLIASYVASVLENMGHHVVGQAVNDRQAFDMAIEHRPDLLVTETRLPTSTGNALINRIRSKQPIDAMIFSGLPEDYFKSDVFAYASSIVAKPARLATLRIGLYIALGGAGLAAHLPAPTRNSEIETQNAILDTESVEFAPAMNLVNRTVRLVHGTPHASTPVSDLDMLRLDHADEARRLLQVGHNLGTSFTSRLSKLSELLDQPLTDETALRIANQAQALASFQSIIQDELGPLQAADTLSFIRSIVQFSRQFPAWRDFLISAELMPAVQVEAMEAAQQLADALTAAPDLVSDEVLDVVAEARAVEADAPSEIGQRYLIGVVRNAYAAIARWCMARASGVAKRFNDQFDEKVGDAMLESLSNLVLVAGAPLAVMASTLPKEFIWVGPAIAAIRSLKK